MDPVGDLSQICRPLQLSCPVCNRPNSFYRLKERVCWPTGWEEDGHPVDWTWQVAGFAEVNPLQFFFAVCPNCFFAAETEDARFRGCVKYPERFIKDYTESGFDRLLMWSVAGEGVVQTLGKGLTEGDLLYRTVVNFHLGIFSQCLRRELAAGNLARSYLRLAWIYRDLKRYYVHTDLAGLRQRLQEVKAAWSADLPRRDDYPSKPILATSERRSLRLALAFFKRNFSLMQEGGPEDELRFKRLVAGIAFRLYRLSGKEEDYQQATRMYSDSIQRCLEIIADKSIVGGVVRRARGLLEISGENGQKLRALRKKRAASLAKPPP